MIMAKTLNNQQKEQCRFSIFSKCLLSIILFSRPRPTIFDISKKHLKYKMLQFLLNIQFMVPMVHNYRNHISTRDQKQPSHQQYKDVSCSHVSV